MFSDSNEVDTGAVSLTRLPSAGNRTPHKDTFDHMPSRPVHPLLAVHLRCRREGINYFHHGIAASERSLQRDLQVANEDRSFHAAIEQQKDGFIRFTNPNASKKPSLSALASSAYVWSFSCC